MKIPYFPIKVIDNFFESATLVREFALDQEFIFNSNLNQPGLHTQPLNDINNNLFNSLASKLIKHCHGAVKFNYLEVRFVSISEIYNQDWIKQQNVFNNLNGVVFLNNEPNLNTGINFYTFLQDHTPYINFMTEEYMNKIENKTNFTEQKKQQQEYFKINMSIENEFNRCVLFHSKEWFNFTQFFGKNIQDSTLFAMFTGNYS